MSLRSAPGRAAAAAIDIGTNSVLLSIAARGASGPEPLLERATITRMGEGVDETRRLAPAAIERNLACLRSYADDLRAYGSPPLDVVGTSALRDAEGASAFLDEAERLLGKRPRVIGGEEEAALTFSGALSGLALSGTLLVYDIGGGSTELILGDAGARGAPESRVSLDIGSVRLFERHVKTDPADPAELAAVAETVIAQLATAAPLLQALAKPNETITLVGVAGTVTTLKALDLGLPAYDGARVHGSALTLGSVERWCDELASLTLDQRKSLPGLEPKRADVIVAGAIIVREILRRAGAAESVVSDRGVRFGLLQKLLDASSTEH